MAVSLRSDFGAARVRRVARDSRDADQVRRLLALAAIVERGPDPAVHGVVRWRVTDLCQWVHEEFRISVSRQTLSRELRAMGYRKLSARPRHHAQAADAIETFKKTGRPAWKRSQRRMTSIPST